MRDTLPIIVDDVKTKHGRSLVRCTYFSIECDTPSPDWTLTLGATTIPFWLLGLSGVITGPVEGEPFSNANDIDKLIHAIEEYPSLFFDTNTVWLPAFLFNEPKRGHAYRISHNIFVLALRFTQHQIDEEEFFNSLKEQDGRARISDNETKAFHEWEQSHIEIAISNYKERGEHNLKWLDEELLA